MPPPLVLRGEQIEMRSDLFGELAIMLPRNHAAHSREEDANVHAQLSRSVRAGSSASARRASFFHPAAPAASIIIDTVTASARNRFGGHHVGDDGGEQAPGRDTRDNACHHAPPRTACRDRACSGRQR